MKQLLYTCMAALALAACSKNDKTLPEKESDLSNRLTFIIDDNKFNFSYFNTALGRTAYKKKLGEEGPFTVLVPDNNAFIRNGYSTENSVLTEDAAILNNIVPYHIIDGIWDFTKLPFAFNQEISSITGASMYITRWVKNQDTVLTINGSRVISRNLKASNGTIQAIDQLLQPMVHKRLSDLAAADTTLTWFNVALQHADMKSLLETNKAYTVFAPSNKAFREAGYPTIESVLNADATVIKNLLRYQLFEGRRFVYDYILTTGAAEVSDQAMLNGNPIQVSLTKTGINYTGIKVKGLSNATYSNILKGNLLAGNGVMHIIDQVLKENQ
ncbi:fasciclin domain-containing protein [Pseudoflavitalea sp. G-6-1-2]|uniref:fasciclin domain-containing protein n=1 Tax=Pseudoflavitalea sp. G-6-1-2 TaxID=2728841 RepID=UPI00146E2EE9|nr:fasciclin domain-containing protein [Pseudoflavitalea sp. G-6-1-2]NML23593.1 fasciclin domain-containing protein [Pseudoflavitalea sp. G-6-1-2]